MNTNQTSLWMTRAFIAINLIIGVKALIWAIPFAVSPAGTCRFYDGECFALGFNWAPLLLALGRTGALISQGAIMALLMCGMIALLRRRTGDGGAPVREKLGGANAARSWPTIALAAISVLVSTPSYWSTAVGVLGQTLGCLPFTPCIISWSDWSLTLQAMNDLTAHMRIVEKMGFLALLLWAVATVAARTKQRSTPLTNIAS